MERERTGTGGNAGQKGAAIERGGSTTKTMNKTMSIALPAELARFVDWQVASGHYASRSEVVRTALRAWAEWDAWVAGTDVARGTDAVDRPDAARAPNGASGGGEAGLPSPLLERRGELLKIAAERASATCASCPPDPRRRPWRRVLD